jgi:hypothetical protein
MSHAFRLGIAFTMRQEDARPDDQVTAVDLGDGQGLTKYGIGQASNPEVAVATLTATEAVAIYARKYWQPLHADALPLPLAVGLFDAGVNHGTVTARRLLQQTLEVEPDGVIGPLTLAAARLDPWRALRDFYAARGFRYAELKNFRLPVNPANPEGKKIGHVWMERLCESYAYCLGLPD